MDFKDKIVNLADKVRSMKDKIQTEEATKTALIMPFLQCLGYDVFNPTEVVPEYTADVGTKKGEKVDYAILLEGKPVIIIECKWWGEDLTTHKNQLIRYFGVTEAKFAILTNGMQYQFFSDLEETNKMDEKAFLDFDLTEMPEPEMNELKKFHKSYFDIDKMNVTAGELKNKNEIKRVLRGEFKNPSPDFVKYMTKQVYHGKATSGVLASFTDIIKKSISEIIVEKFKSALEKDEKTEESENNENGTEPEANEEENRIVTTAMELEAIGIVKSILRIKEIDPERISFKDTLNYLAVNLDDNTRKPICRLWLNAKKKYIGLFDAEKKESKQEIGTLNDIYKYDEHLAQTVTDYGTIS